MLLWLKEAYRRPTEGLYALLLCWLWIWSFKAHTSREVAGTEWLLVSVDHNSEHDCMNIAVYGGGQGQEKSVLETQAHDNFVVFFFLHAFLRKERERPTECPIP